MMTIFESAESAHAHIVETEIEGPFFELAVSDGMTFAGNPDHMGAGMALVLDAILAQDYLPDGFEQRVGYRLYRYERIE
jgi:hypothetical protein